MGRAAAAATATAMEMTKKKKKKGRPSLSDLRRRTLKQQQQQQQQEEEEEHLSPNSTPNSNNSNSRSIGRNPNADSASPAREQVDVDGDDDDERKEKKIKLVVRLPNSKEHYNQPGSSADTSSPNSVSCGSHMNEDGENNDDSIKKLKINAAGERSIDAAPNQGEKVSKVMDALYGSPLGSGPTTPLPNKKMLVFILDRLQKKDTYGVFSEPVDPNELPDYHDIIERPMDFGTVRKKLDEGLYCNLEDFEADVFLICSNAMEYNAPDTIYFRQARTIQELAKRDFENLKQVDDDGKPRPKVVRRGRPPSKNVEKSLGRPPLVRGVELSSDAMLDTGGDSATRSSSYNLRRGHMPLRFQSNNAYNKALNQSHSNETYGSHSPEWNTEFPASILKAEAKHCKKQYSPLDERGATYRKMLPSAPSHKSSPLTTFNGDKQHLVGVGLYVEHGYARSLARFAANLGPVVWRIASRKIESALPPGSRFGPDWLEEDEGLSRPMALPFEKQNSAKHTANDAHPIRPITPPASSLNSAATYRSPMSCEQGMVENVGGLHTQSESVVLKSDATRISPEMASSHARQKCVLQPDRNGSTGVFGLGLSPQMRMVRMASPTGHSGNPSLEEASVPCQMFNMVSCGDSMLTTPVASTSSCAEGRKFSGTVHSGKLLAPDMGTSSLQNWRQSSLSVPPDLNVRFETPGSPGSNFQIGSPNQPDFALQL